MKYSFVKIGLFSAFFSLVVLAIFFAGSLEKQKRLSIPVPESPVSEQSDIKESSKDVYTWERYTNEEYGYTLLYPGLLIKRITRDSQGYLHFVVFLENTLSSGSGQKGVAIGVSDVGIEEEASRIKRIISDDGDGELISEKKFSFAGETALKLDFDPKDPKTSEKRNVVLVVKNGKTFSISTVPSQIDRILESFEFR